MWCAAVPFTADAFTPPPTRHPQYNSTHRARLQVRVARMLGIPWFEADKRGRRAARRPKTGHKDPSTKVEQQRSIEIDRFLQNLVALNEPWAGLALALHVFKRFWRGHRSRPRPKNQMRRRFAMQFCTARWRNRVQNGVHGWSEM